MRRIACLLFFIFALLPARSFALETIVTLAKGASCKDRIFPPPADREHSEWKCEGPGGYQFIYSDHITRGGVIIGHRGNQFDHETLIWSPAKSGIGSRVEWHLEDGAPVFAIVSRWRRALSFRTSKDVDVQ